MPTGEQLTNHFSAFSANFFSQSKNVRAIADTLSREMYHLPSTRLDAYEHHAIAAVASIACAGGDVEQLASEMRSGNRIFSEQDLAVITKASRKLLRNKGFTKELFNGDASQLVTKAIEDAKKDLNY